MKLNRKQKETTLKLIDWWEEEHLLSSEQSNELKESLEIKTINWKKVAEYLMILAIISVVTAFLTLVADEWILELFERLFNLSDLAILILLLILSAGFTFGARKMPSHRKKQHISMQALLVLGSIAFGGALNYFGKISGLSGFGETFLIVIFAVHAFFLSWFFKVILFSGIGWAAMMLWLGIESSPDKNSESGWLGMNLALRYLFFSLIPLFTGMWLKRTRKQVEFARLTERTGWLFLWLALWGVALFGNHNTIDSWEEASSLSLLPWGLLMAGLGVTVWFAGRNVSNKEWMWMGGLALIADAYTQFFLFLWEPLHPALFFALLGGSFWLLGRRAEIIK
ncbi:DUF2157 domain-containing protein [Marinilabilia salmonicolor]|jgi:hypothetical protein|uniref:Putative membrane protein DUF2157 n=1 Tax=Marinilabilia salmonicolor TaxID=989 RepID=A0A2T0XBR8_9BACT|nr:DUF2157 domain-containing protein [Marinilabilia salmonicolor]PRY96385.1 putative membrane protein DUF2157 [Marinilabilia salmonicolor]RCW37560.1 putative membrane protein DUF2157 [Marinilabilia salmonicolor]